MQDDNATSPVNIHMSIEGGDQCTAMVAQGKIAYRFSGTADNADGTALANSLTDATAAKGVAIGIFDADNKPVEVNTGLLPATTDTVFALQMVQLKGQDAVGNINTAVTIEVERLSSLKTIFGWFFCPLKPHFCLRFILRTSR